jgi:acetoin utilization deacetylase AcuC-like enzyme
MGFCLFNNAAIGAAKLAAGGERVAIVDWDVHHGNGTQDMFYADPRILYVSTHQSPLYPGTGLLRETGAGDGVGANVNLPFPPGTAGDTFRAAFDTVVMPVVERFAPDWLIISAGFDAHRNDPLAGLKLTSADFADLARRLQTLVPARRVLVVLEGGYDLEALTYGVGATLSALVGEAFRPEPASGGEIGLPTVVAARQLWEL